MRMNYLRSKLRKPSSNGFLVIAIIKRNAKYRFQTDAIVLSYFINKKENKA
jgi:hypothetical protein